MQWRRILNIIEQSEKWKHEKKGKIEKINQNKRGKELFCNRKMTIFVRQTISLVCAWCHHQILFLFEMFNPIISNRNLSKDYNSNGNSTSNNVKYYADFVLLLVACWISKKKTRFTKCVLHGNFRRNLASYAEWERESDEITSSICLFLNTLFSRNKIATSNIETNINALNRTSCAGAHTYTHNRAKAKIQIVCRHWNE